MIPVPSRLSGGRWLWQKCRRAERTCLFSLTSHRLKALYLGRLSFAQGLVAQEAALARLRAAPLDASGQRLLLLEHTPVFTAGLRTQDPANDTSEAGVRRLTALGADFCRVNRGGLLTFHGPGQLMAYPILQLQHFFPRQGVRCFVDALQRTVVRLCADPRLGALPGAEVTRDVGVWMRGRKLAAIGVSCKRHITAHGLALNCDVDLRWFEHIVACGLVGRAVTSLTAESGRRIDHLAALPAFLGAFQDVFGCGVDLQLGPPAFRDLGIAPPAA